MNNFFAGFIITYQRPDVLLETVSRVFSQTVPPERLWIIDNSEDDRTQIAVRDSKDPRLEYVRVGYNGGPALGARMGLELTAKAGYRWIYWGDDNDPPGYQDTFEKLVKLGEKRPQCGVLGAVGQYFDRKNGQVRRVPSEVLEQEEYLEVDFVAGGMSMIVNASMVESGILPDPGLFFGFEELDFCIRVKNRGYTVLAHSGLFLDLRKKYNRIVIEQVSYKKKLNLKREYFSFRNLLYIADRNRLKRMKIRLIGKWALKSIYGFKFGVSYGCLNARMILLAFYHYLRGIKGNPVKL
ncbi:glycosyltransferase [Negadavirga shengliensis]|uniref:Glycosyltransferase n=1 Tax=Negadavirga shengliensis TaxID=1389218 RepID=A0ABV9T5B2_9BACT